MALPRSRTAWLSRLLSFGSWQCYHEEAMHLRSIDDIKSVFALPNVGFSETAAALGWALIKHYSPAIRAVIVRRKIDDVVNSLMTEGKGIADYRVDELRIWMKRYDRALDKIERLEKDAVLSVSFDDLSHADVCAKIFSHCLNLPMPLWWWDQLESINIQRSINEILIYRNEHRAAIDRFKDTCFMEMIRLARERRIGVRAA
jgi:hypothetical protein